MTFQKRDTMDRKGYYMSNENFQKMMTEYSQKYSKVCVDNNQIDASLFEEYGVKRGLRDKNGKGVLSGITNISLIKASDTKDGRVIPVSYTHLRAHETF